MVGRPGDPVWVVFLTCVLSHLPMIPTIVLLYRRRLAYECVSGAYAVLVSFMYHTCEIFGARAFLTAHQWHRLDNIGAIGSIFISCMHLARFENPMVTDIFKYAGACVIAILQEGYPWDERYTAAPVLVALAVPAISLGFTPRRRLSILWRRLAVCGILFAMSIVFFILGLDDSNDPFRMFHGLFHCFVAGAMFVLWLSMRPMRGLRVGGVASGGGGGGPPKDSPTGKLIDSDVEEYSLV